MCPKPPSAPPLTPPPLLRVAGATTRRNVPVAASEAFRRHAFQESLRRSRSAALMISLSIAGLGFLSGTSPLLVLGFTPFVYAGFLHSLSPDEVPSDEVCVEAKVVKFYKEFWVGRVGALCFGAILSAGAICWQRFTGDNLPGSPSQIFLSWLVLFAAFYLLFSRESEEEYDRIARIFGIVIFLFVVGYLCYFKYVLEPQALAELDFKLQENSIKFEEGLHKALQENKKKFEENMDQMFKARSDMMAQKRKEEAAQLKIKLFDTALGMAKQKQEMESLCRVHKKMRQRDPNIMESSMGRTITETKKLAERGRESAEDFLQKIHNSCLQGLLDNEARDAIEKALEDRGSGECFSDN